MPVDYQPKPRSLWIVALIFAIVVIADSWFRWATYQYRSFDIAFYTQCFWGMLHGQAQSSILDVSLMGNHAEPICFLLLPFFWIWKSPMFFVVIQTLLVSTMPFTGYRIARGMEIERRGALCMALATLIAPVSGFMALHEFHPETLAAPLILLMLEARMAQRAGLFWLYFLLSVACKENVALVVGWMCVVHYYLDRKKGRDWQTFFNVLPGALALGWVALYVLWISPALNGGRVDYEELYGRVGGLSGIIHSPGTALSEVVSAAKNGNLIWCMLGPFLFLPLLRPRWVIICAPIFAQHLLSLRPSEWTIHFHYGAPLLPFLWFGAADCCARLYWRDTLSRWVLVSCIVFQAWMGPIHSVATRVGSFSQALESAKIRSEVLQSIPENASVMVGMPYLSHFAMREKVYSLHFVLKGLKTLSRTEYVPPPCPDFVMVDGADTATFNPVARYYHPLLNEGGRVYPDSDVLLDRFLSGAHWKSYSVNQVTLLTQVKNPKEERPINGDGAVLDDHHRLVRAELLPPMGKTTGIIGLIYEVLPNRQMAPWVRLVLQNAEGVTYSWTKGPLGLGKPAGCTITEAWSFRAPGYLSPGKYRAVLYFYDPLQAHYPDLKRFSQRAFELGEVAVGSPK